MGARILIVDDSKTDMLMIKSILYDYDLRFACDGLEALAIMRADPALDLVILDLNMPRMDGFEVLRAMQSDVAFKNLVTLILTNSDETESEIRGLELGAKDYIRKPLNMESLRKRIEIHLKLQEAHQAIEEYNSHLEYMVHKRTQELVATRDITIQALIGLLEIRNIESSNHSLRTQWMIKMLCQQLRMNGRFISLLTDDYIEELFNTAPLHDIGKVGIPDNILLKPGKLNAQEFDIMKQHASFGVEALSKNLKVEDAASFILTAIEIVGTHHEKYDGSGYPRGLKGDQIPLSGRLMAIVDVYDALTSKRVYKDALTHEAALKIIEEERGRHFDPSVVDAFLDASEDIRHVARQYEQEYPTDEAPQ